MLRKYLALLSLIVSYQQTVFAQDSVLKVGSIAFELIKREGVAQPLYKGMYKVFENNIKGEGKKIPLGIYLLRSSADVKKEPLLVVAGGPGQAAGDLVGFFSQTFTQILQSRDILFVDQRGTGISNPLRLKIDYQTLQDYFDDEFLKPGVVETGFRQLSEGNDLRSYGTYNALLDLKSVMDAMGCRKINIYGTSYGTRLAMQFMEKFPERVRAAVLKGVVSENAVIPYFFAADAEEGLEKIFTLVEKDSTARKNYPDFRNEFSLVLKKLDKGEGKFVLKNPVTQKEEEAVLRRDVFSIYFRNMLMSVNSLQNIPFLVHAAYQGNFTPMAQTILAIKQAYIRGLYDALSLCVVCREDYPKLSRLKPSVKGNGGFMGAAWLNRIEQACRIWNPQKEKSKEIAVRHSALPVLLLSGELDAACPPRYAQQMRKHYPNSIHLTAKYASHSFDGFSGCMEHIITAFIEKGDTTQLDAGCMKSLPHLFLKK